MKRHALLTLFVVAVVAALVVAAACGPSGFTSSTVINSVRILATRADGDKSYAKPGDVVTLETLMVDGRPNKTPPAVTYWIPFVCEDPLDDAYYGCFAPLLGEDAGAGGGSPAFGEAGAGGAGGEDAGGADAGAEDAGAPSPTPSPVISPGALAALFAAGTDITPFLPTGPFTFKVPDDAITAHAPVAGTSPYGLVIIFNIACAGHVKTLPINAAAGPQQVPISCFDDAGNQLGPDQYVIGFTRVYVSATKTNLNPVIAGFSFNGVETPIDAGSGIPGPIAVSVKACGGSCDGVPLDMNVPESSWTGQAKSIWVDYYAMGGGLDDDARLLYDLNAGQVSDSKDPVHYTPTDDAGPATLWAVVHDSNDGVNWLQVNVTAH
jgi:hypothetical protein